MSEQVDVRVIGISMVVEDLPYAFVLQLVEQARTNEVIAKLLNEWNEANGQRRKELEAELRSALDQRDAEMILGIRKRQKDKLRELIDAKGGVTSVARKAGLAQPSLSRMVNTMAVPRQTTLKRLADVLEVSIDELGFTTSTEGQDG